MFGYLEDSESEKDVCLFLVRASHQKFQVLRGGLPTTTLWGGTGLIKTPDQIIIDTSILFAWREPDNTPLFLGPTATPILL